MHFPFMDTIAGNVTSYDPGRNAFDLETAAGQHFEVQVSGEVSAELLRNLDEPYADASDHLSDMLSPGRQLFVYGVFYPEGGGYTFEAKHITFLGRQAGEFNFEKSSWWVNQIDSIARFYRRAQFGTGPVDYREYRTLLRLGGEKTDSHIQETDTISRMVYGMASAYLLTGKEEYLTVAERGTQYLRDHMRFVDPDNDVVYWYHGIKVEGDHEKKLFTSEFGDDYDAVPMYEQIYALAGPTQTYRVTGDRRIASDIDHTMRLFENHFRDREGGGYFSHVDPILLSPHHESLGANRSRKNWNSVGDHAPAYLINALLATDDPRYAEMLERTFDTIVEHFPDYENSPFVNERFFTDWSHDLEHTWQQNRAVVGHNLKIAWNLMRMNAYKSKDSYRTLAEKIAKIMPPVGSDQQRGGWYDVVERVREAGQEWHRFAWHDRKAWWQQEQAILAYLILAGNLGSDDYVREARLAAGFYNAFFLDHDEGAVYFNVLANGLPYLLGTERFKVDIDDKPYEVFDPKAMVVELPASAESLTVRVQLAPVA